MNRECEPTLWAVHFQGPDDIIAQPSLDAANAVVKVWADRDTWEYDRPESERVLVAAVVIKWPHGAESHAAELQKVE